jgi:N4-(beta-N-acetylglucosaminyl)-L-asparaginase
MDPLILSTWSFGTVANSAGLPSLRHGGTALDAVVAAATAVELDPTIDCVGLGGLPDATAIARHVMENTLHVMLAGAAATSFATRAGFKPHNLLTPASRRKWERWRRDHGPDDLAGYPGWLPPANAEERSAARAAPQPRAPESHDTVCILARDQTGTLAGACSTSGMAYKIPGRVGDSPIIGHGLYVDPHVGAAAATGNGELIMGINAAFLVVEQMRGGASPIDACRVALERIAGSFDLHPAHQVALIAIASEPAGGWASAALRPGFVHVVSDAAGTRTERPHITLLES